MKFTKKCDSTQHKISKSNRRRSSAGMFYTSSAGAVISLILFSVFLFPVLFFSDTYATYTISMTSSGAQSIDVLPNSSSGVGTSISEDAITVTTTCPSGYNLTTTTSVNDNKLYLNGSSSASTYFSPSDGSTALSNASNTWGFYQNGSTVPTASSVFSAIPGSSSSAATIRTSSSTNDSFSVYYGVAVRSGLPAGTYKMIPDTNNSNSDGAIVYYLTINEECLRTYMQDVTESDLAGLMPNSGDSTTLYDRRDSSDYQITNINGQYWMTQNLRITGTIPSEGSNFNNVSSWKVDQGDLDKTITPSGYASYTEPRIHSGTDSAGNPTMWYNFCAASANNSGGCSNSAPYEPGTGDVTGDICPSGWRLPTKDEFDGINSYASSFNIIKGGNWYNGVINSTTTAYWWAATNAYEETGYGYRQYYLVANASNVLSTTQNNTRRGEYVRCIKHPEYTTVTVDFAGSGINSVTFSNATYGNQTVSSSGGTATIKTGASYTITANLASGATLTSWLASDGTLGSTTANPTTYITSDAATITATAEKPVGGKLYDLVAAQSKGTQTLTDLRAAITTDNSGVYEYNNSVFGTASDASNDNKIYYYRGILDNTTGTYGSDGDNAAHPNTVVLSSASSKDSLTTSDTCWRIVRTTGSGGVKMIYQGKWTGSTCANATTAAQVTTQAFGGTATAVYKSIVGVGYTRNANYASTSATTATAYSTIFGSNSSYSGNSTASDIKTYIENTWFPTINAYASKLEQSAGWCNDRSIRKSSSSTSVISDSTTIVPYGTSGLTKYYFGSYVRTETTSDKPTLGCPRNNADLYTTSSATNGNKQLGKPAALITADEAAFAGSGYYSSITPYRANSYLHSGSYFWLLSPLDRYSDGDVSGFSLYSQSGSLGNMGVNGSIGVRPSISLKAGSEAVSGSGTATDPWIVNP